MSVALLLAETSKTPFYIAAGILVGWAIVLAALGLARGSFGEQRSLSTGIMVVSAVLVVGATGTAAATASWPEHEGKSALKPLPDEPAVGTSDEPNGNVPGAAGTTTEGSSSSSSSPSSPSSSGSGGAAAPTGTVKVAADQSQLAFDTTSLTAKAGPVTIDFNNPSPIGHDVKVEDSGGKELGGTKLVTGGSTSAKVDLKPGTYTFFCSVPGHREAGMEGKLTVK
jgi:plastocyanin